MRSDDPVRDRQSQSGTGGRAATVQLVKPFEHMTALAFGYARTVVGHFEMDVRANLRDPNLHRTSGPAMAQRVVDKDHQHLAETVAVNLGLDRLPRVHGDVTAGRRPQGPEINSGRADERAHIDLLEIERDLTGINPRQCQ